MENTAKNFALQLGSLVSLYVTIVGLIMLFFSIITVHYPDAAQGYWEIESAATSIRFSIAMLIVFFPVYLVLTRLVNTVRRNEHGTYLMLTKWLIYLSLLVGGAAILGDLVGVINGFLNGELTVRFALKALSFFVVVATAFVYYLFDAKGYWQIHERESISYGTGAAVIVIAALVLGFMNTQTPQEVREYKLDTTQINDLSLIQSNIEVFSSASSKLPETIDKAFAGMEVPTAPEDRAAYEYRITSPATYELCATFAHESSKAEQMQNAQPVYVDNAFMKGNENWAHGEGHWCFTRNVAPQGLQPLFQ
jgi:hypothetical protein